MKIKLLFYSFVIFISSSFISCIDRNIKKDRYFSEEQVKSLKLDDVNVLRENIDSIEKINLNPFLKSQAFNLGSMISEVKILPLETTDESLISNIRKVLLSDSNIYIVDDFKGGSIGIFDNEGRFIKRILTGQAPEEVLRVYDIAFDKEKRELIVFNKYQLSFFSSNGNFIKRQKIPFRANEFCIIPEGYLFKAVNGQGNQHFGYSEEYLFFVVDRDFKLKSVGLPYFYSSHMKYINALGYLYNNGNTINITQPYTDTIYQYNPVENKLMVKYALDLSTKELPEKYLMGTKNDFDNALKQNNYYLFNGKFLETTTHNAFTVENWQKKLQVILFRDKISGNLKGGTKMQATINQIPPINFPVSSYEEYFISLYMLDSRYDFSNNINMSDEDKRKIGRLTEDDNPALVLFKLKNFD